MPKYLVHGNYSDGDGVQGLISDGGTMRRAAVEQLVTSLGGTLECVYFAFGDTDIVALVDMPDNVSAAAVSIRARASGLVGVRIIVLMTAEEVDAAAKKMPTYRPPGH